MGGTRRGVFSPQNKVALAQAALYVIVAPTVFLVFIWPKRFRPKPTCLILFLFSALRLGSSILHLIHSSMKTRGENLRIPTIILYNIGLLLLVAAATASIRAIKSTAIPGCRWIRSTGSAIYISLVTSFVFIVLGNAFELREKTTGQALVRTALVLVGLGLIAAVTTLLFLLRHPKVVEGDRVLIGATLLSVAFIIIRTVYAFLFQFAPDPWDTDWNPIMGDALSFGLMSMAPEFLALFFQLVPFATDVKLPTRWRRQTVTLAGA